MSDSCTRIYVFFRIFYVKDHEEHLIKTWQDRVDGQEVSMLSLHNFPELPLFLVVKRVIENYICYDPSDEDEGCYIDETPENSFTCECYAYEIWHYGETKPEWLDRVYQNIQKHPNISLGMADGGEAFYIEFDSASFSKEELKEPAL